MKKIIFLIVTFMSFSAEAKMKLLWSESTAKATIKAYCVYEDRGASNGTVYLLARVKEPTNSANITFTPLVVKNSNSPYVRC